MRAGAEPSLEDWRSVLEYMGLEPRAARRIKQGRNTHWLIATPTERVVLRHYHDACTPSEVAYELTVLQHLDARGWPVAVPISDVVKSSVGLWCLLTYVPGRQRAPRTLRGRYAEEVERGRLLARLHADLAGLERLGQRDGW